MQLKLMQKNDTPNKRIRKYADTELEQSDNKHPSTDIKLNLPESITFVEYNGVEIQPLSATSRQSCRRSISVEFLKDGSPFSGFEDQPIFRISGMTPNNNNTTHNGEDIEHSQLSFEELPIAQSSEYNSETMNNIGNIVEIVTTQPRLMLTKSSTRSGNRSQTKETVAVKKTAPKATYIVQVQQTTKREISSAPEVIQDKENVEDAVTFLIENVDLDIVKTDEEIKIEAYEKRKHKCQVCGKRFVGKSNLVDHLRFHANVKPFKCSYCEKSFVQLGSLRCHMRIHTNEKPYSCEICQRSFSQTSSLKIHIRTHTRERKYACELCDKRFMSNSDVSKHRRIHDDVKRYQCKLCEKGFAQNVNLQKHLRNHHKMIDSKSSTVKNSKSKS